MVVLPAWCLSSISRMLVLEPTGLGVLLAGRWALPGWLTSPEAVLLSGLYIEPWGVRAVEVMPEWLPVPLAMEEVAV